MKILLKRFSDDSKETQSTITVVDSNLDVLYSCVALELPDKNNQHNISCIPKGEYNWRKVSATAHINYPHVEILNVPNRSGILIHIGNYAFGSHVDIEGCVIVGRSFNDINGDGEIDVANSRITMNALMTVLSDNGTIEIY